MRIPPGSLCSAVGTALIRNRQHQFELHGSRPRQKIGDYFIAPNSALAPPKYSRRMRSRKSECLARPSKGAGWFSLEFGS